MIYYIPFTDITDLIAKVEKMKMAHEIQANYFRKLLDKKDINYKVLDKYLTVVDFNDDPEILEYVTSMDDSILDDIYGELGVEIDEEVSLN